MKGLLASSLLLVTLSLSAAELPVRGVVVFKNGIGFVTRAGDVEFRDGRAVAGRVPPATYGGLWVALDGGIRVDEAVASSSKVTRSIDAASIADLLDANDGRTVTLQLEDRALAGMLRSTSASSFALVESGGRTTAIANHRKERVTVDVTRTVTGSVSAAGEGGMVVRLAEEPSAINPRSKLDWSVPIGAGETRTVTYQYRVWVRR